MHDYGVPPEGVRLALALGITISMLVYERWRWTSGAAVVAGYLALFMNRPLYIISTILLAVITYTLVQKYIARRLFLYGRRRLVVMVLVGMILQFLIGLLVFLTSVDAPWLAGLYGVGFVLPGLIAQDMERQGVQQTVLTVWGTAVLTFLIFHALLSLKSLLFLGELSQIETQETIHYSYQTRLLIPAVILSVLVSAILFEKFKIRSGGFLSAAYLALFVLQPQHLLLILLLGIIVYLLVTFGFMKWLPLFGRTKFATMVLTGLVLTWVTELGLAQLTQNSLILFAGFSLISPMIVALVANDSERQGLPKTLVGVITCTMIVFVIIKSLDFLW